MDTRVEFNNVIALRPWQPEAAIETIVPPENELAVGWGHPFRKSGHRIYPVDERIALLESEKYPVFTRLIGYVEIKYYGVEMTPNGVETFGEYVIKKVATKEEGEAWLAIYNPRV